MKRRIFLIGQRGSGKSSALKYFAKYGFAAYDLDAYLEKFAGMSIQELFKQGEPLFRATEIQAFHSLLSKKTDEAQVIALGAGFPLKKIEWKKVEGEIWWLNRRSDAKGRIFLNRPRIYPELPPLQESLELYNERLSGYQDICHRSFAIPEGKHKIKKFFKKIIKGTPLGKGFIKTLHSHKDLLSLALEDLYVTEYDKVELRNDLLSDSELQTLLEHIPHDKILLSLRERPSKKWLKLLGNFNGSVDLDEAFVSSYAALVSQEFLILSLHRSNWTADKSLLAHWRKQFPKAHLKYAPELNTLTELQSCHDFCIKDKNLSFLPRSQQGQWLWYRIHQRKKNLLNFVRDCTQSLKDQPRLWDIKMHKEVNNEFFAVLGEDVSSSLSPNFHSRFCLKRKSAFYSLSLPEAPNAKEVLFLRSLGLQGLAVTSPYKSWAAEQCAQFKPTLANTLFFGEKGIIAENTDWPALKKIFKKVKESKVLVWGAGAMGQQISQIIPQAELASVREAQPQNADYELVIWATLPTAPLPTLQHCQRVLDMNYAENSRAIELALLHQCDYCSGKKLFKEQALLQQKFWASFD